MIRIVVANEHEIVRIGLKCILSGCVDLEVVGEASTTFETIQALRTGHVDVLIMDLMPMGRGGIDLILRIRREVPHLPILVLTTARDIDHASRAIKAGASGHITNTSGASLILKAVRRLAEGRLHISDELAEQFLQEIGEIRGRNCHEQLSDREFEVFLRIAKGENCTCIARSLSLSIKTISTHKVRIMKKLSLSSVSELVQYAVAHKLVPDYII